MTKEELKQEAEEWLNKWELCNKCENKVDCISNFSYCKKVVLQSYLASAEPREKQIAELRKDKKELCHSISEGGKACVYLNEQLTKAKEIILRLYNAGRDVLMCRAEEKAYDNLSNAINDKSIEQFISEVEK